MVKNYDFIKQSKEKWGDTFDYSNVKYVNAKTKVCIICNELDENGNKIGEFWTLPYNHLHKKNGGCKKLHSIRLSKDMRMGKEEFIKQARLIHGDKYDYSQVVYINNRTNIYIICHEKDILGNEHGGFWIKPEKHLNRKQGCPRCIGRYKTNEIFIAEARAIHGDKYDYSKVNYQGSHVKVCIICPEHGEFWQTPHDHLSQKSGCPSCNQSHLEKVLYLLFIKYNINFIYQFSEKDFSKQEIDFYLPDHNIAIECQGIQHFKPTDFGGKGEEWANSLFTKCLFLDKRKYDICLNKGYEILYFTDKKNLIKGYKTDSKYNSIYNEKNVFVNEKKLLKKIIDMT